MTPPRSLWFTALAGLLTSASAAPQFAAPPPGLIPFEPKSVWRNVGFGAWVEGDAGAQGVFISVDVDPTDHRRILTATQFGGLWLTEDGGKSWKNVDHALAGMNYFREIRFVKETPSLVYAVSAFGLARSRDGGRTWQKMDSPEIDQSACYPSEPCDAHMVFLETARRGETIGIGHEHGLLISTDGGTRWTKVFDKPVTSFKFHPANPDILYVAALRSGSINAANWTTFHRSEDGGKTWTEITAGLPVEKHKDRQEQFACMFIRTTPKFPDRVFIMGMGGNYDLENKHDVPSMWDTDGKPNGALFGIKGLWVSDDAGKSFKNRWNDANDVLPPTADRPNLTTNLENVEKDRTQARKFYVSGLHQGRWDMVFEISEDNPDIMVCGAQSPWLSTDGGKSWRYHYEIQAEADPSITDDESPQLRLKNHVFHGDFQCARIIGNKIWMGNDGGLTRTDDLMRTMNLICDGTTGVEPWGFDMSWQDPDIMNIACNHGPVHLKYPKIWATEWINLGGGDSSQCFINPADTTLCYGPWSVVHHLPESREPDAQTILERRRVISRELGADLFHSVASPFDANRAHALYGQRKIKSSHGRELVRFNGDSVEKAIRRFDSEINDLTTAHTVPGFLYLVEGGRLWLSRDAGVTFRNITPKADVKTVPQGELRLVAADQTKANVLYAAGNRHHDGRESGYVIMSKDNGANWTDITGSLYTTIRGDGPVKDLECQAGTYAGLYVATASRVAYRDAAVSDWTDLSAGLPASNIINYVKTAPALGLLRICSNKGVFERQLVAESEPFVWVRAKDSVQRAKAGPYTVKWFDVSAVSRKATFTWRFPGGTPETVTGQAATVTYAKPGNYDAHLEINDGGKILRWSAKNAMRLGTLTTPKVVGAGANLRFSGPGRTEVALGAPAESETFTLAARIMPSDNTQPARLIALEGKGETIAMTLDADGRLGATRGNHHVSGPRLPKKEPFHAAVTFTRGRAIFFLDGKPAGEASMETPAPMRFAAGDTLAFGDTTAALHAALDDTLVMPGSLSIQALAALAADNTGEAPAGALAYFDFNVRINGSHIIDCVSGNTFAPDAAASLMADSRLQRAFAAATAREPADSLRPPLAELRFACSKAEFYRKVGVTKPKADPTAGIDAFLSARKAHAEGTPRPAAVTINGTPVELSDPEFIAIQADKES